jgi:hypothetical protein
VDADEHRLIVRDRVAVRLAVADAALAQGQVRLRVDGALVRVERERAPRCRQRDALDALDELLALEAVADQVRDRAHLQVVLVAESSEIVRRIISPSSRMISQMTAAGFRPARRRDRWSLRSARANEHAALAAAQRVDVAGTQQVLRLGVLGDGDFDRLGAIATRSRRSSRRKRLCASTVTVNACPSRRCALDLRMRWSLSHVSAVSARQTTPRACVTNEVDRFRRDLLRGDDEVALVFAVFIVNQHDHAARP